MIDRIEQLQSEAQAEIDAVDSTDALEDVRIRYLGRKAELPNLLRGVAQLPPEERRAVGKAANAARQSLEAAVAAREQALAASACSRAATAASRAWRAALAALPTAARSSGGSCATPRSRLGSSALRPR